MFNDAQDSLEVARIFNIDVLPFIGRSGGAPRALACLAIAKATGMQSVFALALSGVAPPKFALWEKLDGLGKANTEDLARSPAAFEQETRARVAKLRKDPYSRLRFISADFQPEDWEIVTDPAYGPDIATSHFHTTVELWADDFFASRKDWEVENILRSALRASGHIHAAKNDPFVQAGHARAIANPERISGYELTPPYCVIAESGSHFSSMNLEPFIDQHFGPAIERYRKDSTPHGRSWLV